MGWLYVSVTTSLILKKSLKHGLFVLIELRIIMGLYKLSSTSNVQISRGEPRPRAIRVVAQKPLIPLFSSGSKSIDPVHVAKIN